LEEAQVSDRHHDEIVPAGDPDREQEPTKPMHGNPQVRARSSPEALAQRESGQPGGGAGRRDDVGRPGVYPISGEERPSGEAELRPLGDWAGGDRGIAGYEDSGGSELVMRDGVVLGGLTSDGSGRPTIDIHGASPEQREAPDAERARPDDADATTDADDERR
jgi:hypothetical protein